MVRESYTPEVGDLDMSFIDNNSFILSPPNAAVSQSHPLNSTNGGRSTLNAAFPSSDGNISAYFNSTPYKTEGNSKINPNLGKTPSISKHIAMPTLKEQERIIDDVKKENFSLKMKIFHLEEQMKRSIPKNMEAVLNETVDMKIANEALQTEIERLMEHAKQSSENMTRLQHEKSDQLKAAVERYRQFESKMSAMEARLAAFDAELSEKNEVIGRLESKLTLSKQREESILETLTNERQVTLTKQNEYENLLAQVEVQIEALSKENDEKDRKVEELQESFLGIQHQLSALSSEKTKMLALSVDSEAIVAKLQMEKMSLEESLLDKTSLLLSTQNDLIATQSLIADKDAALNILGSTKAAMLALQDEKSSLEKTILSFQVLLKEKDASISVLESSVASAAVLIEEKKILEGKLSDLQALLKEKEASVDSFQTQLDIALSENDKYFSVLNSSAEELESILATKSGLEIELKMEKQTLDATKVDLEAARKELNQLEKEKVDFELKQEFAKNLLQTELNAVEKELKSVQHLLDLSEISKAELEDRLREALAEVTEGEQKMLELNGILSEKQITLNNSNAQIAQLRGQCTNLESKYTSLQETLESEEQNLNNDLGTLTARLATAEGSCAEAAFKLTAALQLIEEKSQELKKSEQIIIEKARVIEALEQELSVLDDQQGQLVNEVDAVENKISQWKNQNAQLENRLKDLVVEIAKLGEENHTLIAEKEELSNKIKKLNKNLTEMKVALEEKSRQLTHLEAKHTLEQSNLTDEIKALKQKHAETSNQFAEYKRRSLEEANAVAAIQSHQSQQIDALNVAEQQDNSAAIVLKNVLQTTQREKEAWIEKHDNLAARQTELSATLAEKQNQLSSLENSLNSKEHELVILNQSLLENTTQIEELSKDLKESGIGRDRANSRINKHTEQLRKMEKDLKDLTAECSHLKSLLADAEAALVVANAKISAAESATLTTMEMQSSVASPFVDVQPVQQIIPSRSSTIDPIPQTMPRSIPLGKPSEVHNNVPIHVKTELSSLSNISINRTQIHPMELLCNDGFSKLGYLFTTPSVRSLLSESLLENISSAVLAQDLDAFTCQLKRVLTVLGSNQRESRWKLDDYENFVANLKGLLAYWPSTVMLGNGGTVSVTVTASDNLSSQNSYNQHGGLGFNATLQASKATDQLVNHLQLSTTGQLPTLLSRLRYLQNAQKAQAIHLFQFLALIDHRIQSNLASSSSMMGSSASEVVPSTSNLGNIALEEHLDSFTHLLSDRLPKLQDNILSGLDFMQQRIVSLLTSHRTALFSIPSMSDLKNTANKSNSPIGVSSNTIASASPSTDVIAADVANMHISLQQAIEEKESLERQLSSLQVEYQSVFNERQKLRQKASLHSSVEGSTAQDLVYYRDTIQKKERQIKQLHSQLAEMQENNDALQDKVLLQEEQLKKRDLLIGKALQRLEKIQAKKEFVSAANKIHKKQAVDSAPLKSVRKTSTGIQDDGIGNKENLPHSVSHRSQATSHLKHPSTIATSHSSFSKPSHIAASTVSGPSGVGFKLPPNPTHYKSSAIIPTSSSVHPVRHATAAPLYPVLSTTNRYIASQSGTYRNARSLRPHNQTQQGEDQDMLRSSFGVELNTASGIDI